MTRKKRYELTKSSADKLTDAIGCKIDFKIKELVVYLNLNKFVTFASCQGHRSHGLRYPWIDFDIKSYNGLFDFIKRHKIVGLEIKLLESGDGFVMRLQPVDKTRIKAARDIFHMLEKKLSKSFWNK